MKPFSYMARSGESYLCKALLNSSIHDIAGSQSLKKVRVVSSMCARLRRLVKCFVSPTLAVASEALNLQKALALCPRASKVGHDSDSRCRVHGSKILSIWLNLRPSLTRPAFCRQELAGCFRNEALQDPVETFE